VWGEILTAGEVEYCELLRKRLARLEWAKPLLAKLPAKAALTYNHKPLLYELRLAAELAVLELAPRYEAATGVNGSTVDFELKLDGLVWRIELVSILTSDALKAASWDGGNFFGAQLSSGGPDLRQSVEGEILLTQQKIGEKAFAGGRPIKFPVPAANNRHLIAVDVRGMAITGADSDDCREICYGHHGVLTPFAHYWKTSDGKPSPILGLFDPANDRQRAAPTIRERIHFVGFSNDQEYTEGSLLRSFLYCSNPSMFKSTAEEIAALSGSFSVAGQPLTAPSSLRSCI
jgi:hypothetical protein